MDIAISFDKNYLSPFYALITSIFENNKGELLTFHLIINENVSETEFLLIQNYISKNGASFKRYEVDETLLAQFVISGNWTSSVYYKMFFPILVDQSIVKLLYLDTDMVVVGPLKPLFELNLSGFPLAAVYDNYVKTQPEIGIIEEGKYFNSGMLLYNIREWNIQHISQRAVQYLGDYPNNIKFVDQCALNAVVQGNWLRVSEKFNLLYSYIPENISQRNLKFFMNDKVVVHFTLQRPWNMLCRSRLRNDYFKYLKQANYVNAKYIVDFSISKLIDLIKLRIEEYYFDSLFLQNTWRFIKINIATLFKIKGNGNQ